MKHHHDHSHAHHNHAPNNFGVAFALAVGLNLGFTIIEAIYALIANSMSLLADAGHNLGDVLGLAISWGAMWLLAKKATNKYSYGFKRTTILAALINALLLLGATVGITIESIHKLITPVHVNEKIVIIIALIGIVINGGTALLFMKGQNDLNIKSAFLHLAYDALISFGVVLTGIVIYFTRWNWLDPIIGLVIAITILLGTWQLLRQSVDLILDAVPHGIDHNAVRDFLLTQTNITAVHDLHIWGLSTKETALTAHLIVPNNNLDDTQLQKIHDTLATRFNIKHTTLQVERCHENSPCQRAEECC